MQKKTVLVIQAKLGFWLAVLGLLSISSCQVIEQAANQPVKKAVMDWSTPELPGLNTLAIDNLRGRTYGSQFEWLTELSHDNPKYHSVIASYISDGLRIYARIDIPNKAPPKQGYPLVLFSHGWVGLSKAKDFDFFAKQQGSQAQYLNALAEDGFVIITPGWRGHGTVKGKQADGIEFIQRWDNATYIGPIFYAIDMLNALDSIGSLSSAKWGAESIAIDLERVSLSGHSQGGDSALFALAVAGESSMVKNRIHAASIFSGCFLPRLKQGELYGSMSMSAQGFMAGDGSWTASPQGHNGELNPDFQFSFPPDWIGTTVQSDWTWQHDVWSRSTVKQAFIKKYDEMYDGLKKNHLTRGVYQLKSDEKGRTKIEHPRDIQAAYAATSPIEYPQYLQEPLVLHHSDRDYYSPPEWNEKLVASVVKSGGTALNFAYPGNTHSLTISEHKWFSEDYSQAGLDKMIAHDIKWFKHPTQ
ncbi:MAG: pimeloyl-ACP methyl ester carboxylesterase [Paraglaciecola sp.]